MRREFRFAISFGAAAALALLAILPEHTWAGMPALCPFRRLAGLECFGCGITRALASALHGNWESAWKLNPLFVPALLVLTAAMAQPYLRWSKRRITSLADAER